jgi:putative hemolysin
MSIEASSSVCNAAPRSRLGVASEISGTANYQVRVAEKTELEAIFRLRYQVFFEEMGADPQHALHAGLDVDGFDAFCDHMVVTFGKEVVGTYRLLPNARLSGLHASLYTESEFEVSGIKNAFGNKLLELGRSCVHVDHRSGIVPRLLWAGVAQYIQEHDIDAVIGCVSVYGLSQQKAELMKLFLMEKGHWTETEELVASVKSPYICSEVFERSDFQDEDSADVSLQLFPPLLKGYLNLGAKVAGGPAYDKDFGCHDFLMVLEKSRMNPKYSRSLLNRSSRRVPDPVPWPNDLRLIETPV